MGFFACCDIDLLCIYAWGGGQNLSIKNLILLLASIFFYAWGEPVYVFLLIISTVVNYVFGIFIHSCGSHKKAILFCNICFNLSILFYFKYCNFAISTINFVFHTDINDRDLPLPLGISFFTFQAMSYVIDVYRKDCKAEKNIINVALYLFFFPQLIAGPIVKYKEIGQQIHNRRETAENLAMGIRKFCYGLGKKVIIANTLASVVDYVASIDTIFVNSAMAWIMVVFYTLQIYYDFSGYSDMAIGMGRMFGFEIRENFNYPYLSTSVNEFWRRWHISLGTWFREYVYIPLGGNRKGSVRMYLNLFLVFFLTGLWHGAGWNFVFWGIYHGIFIMVERMGWKNILDKHPAFSHVYMVLVCGIGWLFFYFTNISQGFVFLKRMFLPWQYTGSPYSVFEIVSNRACMIAVLAVCGCGILQKYSMKHDKLKKLCGGKMDLVYCAVLAWLSFGLLANGDYNPFIYFRF